VAPTGPNTGFRDALEVIARLLQHPQLSRLEVEEVIRENCRRQGRLLNAVVSRWTRDSDKGRRKRPATACGGCRAPTPVGAGRWFQPADRRTERKGATGAEIE
jgi:hypothetical protein